MSSSIRNLQNNAWRRAIPCSLLTICCHRPTIALSAFATAFWDHCIWGLNHIPLYPLWIHWDPISSFEDTLILGSNHVYLRFKVRCAYGVKNFYSCLVHLLPMKNSKIHTWTHTQTVQHYLGLDLSLGN